MATPLPLEPSTAGVRPFLDHAAVEAARLIRSSRARLLEQHPSVTVDMLAEGRATRPATARQWLHRHRRAGRLITVEDDGRVLIPGYQLDDAFDLDRRVAAVTGILAEADLSGWAIWRWFTTVNPWLDDVPLDLIRNGDTAPAATAAERLLPA